MAGAGADGEGVVSQAQRLIRVALVAALRSRGGAGLGPAGAQMSSSGSPTPKEGLVGEHGFPHAESEDALIMWREPAPTVKAS